MAVGHHGKASASLGLAFLLGLVVGGLLLAQAFDGPAARGEGQSATMSLDVDAPGAACDNPTAPTRCTVPPGQSFRLSISVDNPPIDEVTQEPERYVGFQTQLYYGDLTYLPTAVVGDEIVWPQSALPLRSPAAPTGFERMVAHADVTAQSPPLPPSSHTGSIVDLTLSCPQVPRAVTIALLSYDPISQPLGAGFKPLEPATETLGPTVPAKPTGQRALDVDGNAGTPPEAVNVAAALTVFCGQPDLPDLQIVRMQVELETGSSCGYTSTTLGVRVVFENAGDAAAGPFVVAANGAEQFVSSGLAPGAIQSLWFSGFLNGTNSAVIDSLLQVVESDEGNNELSLTLAVPTLPPTCTPTPTPTRTPTNTPTPRPVYGDVNCDGRVNSIDAALILQFVAGLSGGLACPQNADVDNRGGITAIDAALILQFSAGLVDSLPP